MYAFEDALDEHLNAIRERRVERFAGTLADDVTVIDGRGVMQQGTTAVLRSHAEWFASDERWSFDYTVRLKRTYGGAGLALLEVRYRHTPDAAASRFLLSLLFARDAAGRWKFVYDQNTPLAAGERAAEPGDNHAN